MPEFPAGHAALVEQCRGNALPVTQRGAALEELIAGAFAAIPGVRVQARNAKSIFENEELDLVMANQRKPDGLHAVGPHFSVECKNWSRPVGSIEIAWFATKLRRSGQGFGVLVAAHGVTGRAACGARSYESEPALLCLLAWSVDWLTAMRDGRWPPPWT